VAKKDDGNAWVKNRARRGIGTETRGREDLKCATYNIETEL